MNITEYTTADCFYCFQLKELFKRANIEAEIIEIVSPEPGATECEEGTMWRWQFADKFPDIMAFPYVIIDGEGVGGLVPTAKRLVKEGLVSANKG